MKVLRALFALVFCPFCLLAAPAPTLQNINPAPGTVSSLTQITVTFSVPVTAPAAEDLLVNGNSASGVSGSSSNWTFTFSQPAPGLVSLSWDGSHGIYDLSGNRFDELAAGSRWSYTLVDVLAPAVLSTSPTPGAALGTLSQIEVIFREPVQGVDASDLVINGQPASTVSGAGAGPYLFMFTLAPPIGALVTVNWAAGHGITDLATPANAFGGGTWTYAYAPGAVANVVLNEIMAENLTGLLDEEGDTSDWIELYNAGASPVNLLGWSLTDDPARPGQWVFPVITLNAGQYLLVFASGKDRAVPLPGTNHLNFTLAGSEYLGLYNAQLPRQVASEFAPVYPEQRGDVAWGRTSSNTLAYFATATPRAVNSGATNYNGFAESPHASVRSGLFAQPFQVALSSPTAGSVIYYTLNGDVPTPANGQLYSGLISVAGSSNQPVVPLRAAAFKEGSLPSTVLTRTYVFPDFVLQQPITPPGFPASWVSGPGKVTTSGDYEMDPQVLTNGNNLQIARQALAELPVVSLVGGVNTFFAPNTGVYTARVKQGNQKAVNAEMWLPDGTRVFQSDCGFEVQGGSSPSDSGSDWKDKKLSLRLIFKGDFGSTKLQAKVFEDTPVQEFNTLILDAGLNFWWTHMTDADQRNRAKFITDQFTSDLMNNAGMVAQHGRFVHLYLNGLYWGLYDLHERMDEAAAASYLGGQKEEWDVLKHTGDAVGLQNGTLTSYNAMLTLARAGVANNAAYEQLQTALDMPWLADYLIINLWAGNTDWPNHNWYAWHRTRAPGALPWRFVSWDAEHTVKSFTENRLGIADANSPGEIFQALRNNAEFKVLFGDRVHKLMFNGGPLYSVPNRVAFWSATNQTDNIPAATYRKRVDEIWNSVVCESARWGDVATARTNQPYTRELEYTRELNSLYMLTNISGQTPNYFPLRGSNVLAQFRGAGLYPTVAAPAFSQHGGKVAAGYALVITNVQGAGTVYYTTNGADPRAYGSGAVAPGSLIYSGTPLTLDRSMTVKARVLSGVVWSALNEAAFTVGLVGVPLRITELMYDPVAGPAPAGAYEFIELWNAGANDLDLSGYYFDGVSFSFPPAFVLASGARIVLASDANPAAFAARYVGVPVAGYFGGALNNAGERLSIRDAFGRLVLSVDYDNGDGWPNQAGGGGYSLEILDPNGDPDDPGNWRASPTLNGSPGLPSAGGPANGLVLNEVQAENLTTIEAGGSHPDWVELYNAGATALDLTGWSLSDNADPRRFVFSAGPILAAGGYLVVYCDNPTNPAPGLHTGFALDRDGGRVLLYDPASNRVDAVIFGNQLADYSIGRSPGGWRLDVPTPGAANVAAVTGAGSDLRINEWLANAAPGGGDWLELYNGSASPAALSGIFLETGGTVFRYATLTFIPPHGFLQLLADEAPGPAHLDFKLAASGATLLLYDTAGVEVDRVSYGNQAEGVSQGRLPDGTGAFVSFPGSTSPNAANYVLDYRGPKLNEVLARNDTGEVTPWGSRADWVEIVNTNAATASLAGFALGDSPGSRRWLVPAGVSIPGNGFLRIWCDGDAPASTNATTSLNTGFALSARSGGVYLFGTNGLIMDLVEYGPQVPDLSIGRTLSGWKLLAAPTPGAANSAPPTLGPPTALRINEWMAATPDGEDWFELYNPAASPVELSGLRLTDDPSLNGLAEFQIAPLSFIGAHGFTQFQADGDPNQGRDHVNFNLDGAGDSLRLYDAGFNLLDGVDFGPAAAGASSGRLPDGSASIVAFPGSATPGESNYRPLPNAVINEVLTHTDDPLEDAIEIHNPSAQGADIGGWYLSDDAANWKKYQLPAGTFLAGGGYLVIYQAQFNSGPGAFTLDSAGGDQVFLSEADAAGNLSGFRAVARFGAAQNGVSFGRVETCHGGDFVALARRSFGEDTPASLAQFRTGMGLFNAEPKVGPVIFNEVMYHPPGNGTNDNSLDEYIKLANVSGVPAPLFETAHPANTWRLRGGVEYTFPPNVTLPAGGLLLLVNFNPANAAQLAAFRSLYGVGAGVPIYGPYSGKLDNGGETLELQQPDPPQAGTGFVPYVLVERLSYGATAAWGTNADGGGASLQRRSGTEYGNDAANWVASAPTAGQLNAAAPARAPSLITPPLGRTVLAGSRVLFSVSVCGSRPLNYLWKRNGSNLAGGTNAFYVVSNAQAGDVGDYTVQISNAGGNVTSPPAALALGTLPVITQQPQSQSVAGGGTATLNVQATGSGLSYQWRRNGLPIVGATAAAFVIENATARDSATYSVVVGNAVGTVSSALATLAVLVPPTITQQPQHQSVAPGGTATFTVAAAGVGVVRYQWQFNGLNIDGATGSSLTISNAQLAQEGDYRVQVADDIIPGFSQTVRLTVRVPPTIVVPPRGQTNVVGSTMTFTVVTSGSVPMAYRWLRGSLPVLTNILYSTNCTFTITNAQASQSATYRIVLTNSGNLNPIVNATFAVLVVAPPVFNFQPISQSVSPGADVTFSPSVGGTAPLGYQWRFQGADLLNATNLLLTLTNVQPANQGAYQLVASNYAGLATSTVATLTVTGPPTIISQPRSQEADLGGNASFAVEAIGVGPLSYQWRFNAQDLGGQTGPGLALANLQPAQAGPYSVRVSNGLGFVDSLPATLTLRGQSSLQNLERLPDGTVHMALSGLAGRTYAIEFSANLQTWSQLTTVTYTSGLVPLTDGTAVGVSNRFYRARLLP